MEEKPLYAKRGGGLTRLTILLLEGRYSVTWPLAKLELWPDRLIFTMPRVKYELSYPEINSADISRWGYIIISRKDQKPPFGFTHADLPKILELLRSRGVAIDPDAMSKLRIARVFIRAQIVYAWIFGTVWAGGLLVILLVLLFKK